MANGIELAKAYVQIVPTTDGIQSDLTTALTGAGEKAGEKGGKSIASGIGSAFGGIGKAVAAGTAAAATAAAGFGTAVVKGAADLASYGDDIDKMSQKMGLSAEAYQEWDAVMQHSGTSITSLQTGMKTLANAVESGNEAFQRIGLTEEQIASMSQEDLFSSVITGLQNVEDTTERTYLAGQLLGRGATELGALLNTSAEDTQAMKDRVHELGGVLSDDVVKESAAFQDNLQDMQTAMDGMKRSIMSQALPGLNQLMTGFTSLIIGEEGAEDALAEGFGTFLDDIGGIASRVGEVAATIIPEFASVIVEHLPEIIETGIGILMTLFGAIIENLPTMIETVLSALPTIIPQIVTGMVQLVTMLLENLPTILQAIIAALPDILISLIDALMTNLPILIEGVVTCVLAIAEQLPAILSALWEVIVHTWTTWIQPMLGALGQWLGRVWDSIVGVFGQIGGWIDANVIQPVVGFFKGLWDNLKNGAKQAWEGIKGVFSAVGDWFKNIFSKAWQKVKDVFSTGGKIFSGIKEGIANVFKTVVNAIIRGINTVIAVPFNAINGFLNVLRGITILGLKPFGWVSTFNVPQIPQLAEGGVINGPRLILAGEDGAEAIVPIERNTEWIQRVAAEIRENDGGSGSDLLDAVETIAARLDRLQIVLDGDRLVGGISERMDRALGTNQGLAQRGVATA